MKELKLYRPNVGIMLLNKKAEVFVAHRTDSRKQAWQMPKGGIDKGEDEYHAALRELYEETNISSVTLIAESKNWYSYDFPPGIHFFSPKKKEFVGQMQKWFLFQFTGNETEIDLNRPDPEFNQWKWIDVEKVVELIVDFKKEVYRHVVDEFLPFIDAIRK